MLCTGAEYLQFAAENSEHQRPKQQADRATAVLVRGELLDAGDRPEMDPNPKEVEDVIQQRPQLEYTPLCAIL